MFVFFQRLTYRTSLIVISTYNPIMYGKHYCEEDTLILNYIKKGYTQTLVKERSVENSAMLAVMWILADFLN